MVPSSGAGTPDQAAWLAVITGLVSAWFMADTDKPDVNAAARCACGGVSVTVRGRVLSMLMCSCEDCQKATGSGHSAFALFRADDVTVTGEMKSFERPSSSGAIFTRWFCPNCGTPLCGRSSRAVSVTVVPVGLFGRTADWYRPNQLIFARTLHAWDAVDDSLPRWQTYRDEEELH
ncbi:MAG: hypothetical protein EON57_10215 [Alphaproteobacteria bacterium]|nr:MAG: hypothetical protein EON57_10215 [Alphaproteobacteria bacterium]